LGVAPGPAETLDMEDTRYPCSFDKCHIAYPT